jgi:hypothetical protein
MRMSGEGRRNPGFCSRERVGFAWNLTLAITHVAWVELRKPFEDDNSFLGRRNYISLRDSAQGNPRLNCGGRSAGSEKREGEREDAGGRASKDKCGRGAKSCD